MTGPQRLAVLGLVAFLASGAAVHATSLGSTWSLGGNGVALFEPTDVNALQATAGTLDVESERIVSQGADGNFEFEHGVTLPSSTFLAVDASNRETPLQLGAADGQDVTPLMVEEDSAVTADLQSWRENGKIVTALDPHGGLRINGITLRASVAGNGAVALLAILPNGSRQKLVPVARP